MQPPRYGLRTTMDTTQQQKSFSQSVVLEGGSSTSIFMSRGDEFLVGHFTDDAHCTLHTKMISGTFHALSKLSCDRGVRGKTHGMTQGSKPYSLHG